MPVAETSPTGGEFFSSRFAETLFKQYRARYDLDPTMAQVGVRLRSGEELLVEEVHVAAEFLVFATEDDEYVCVPRSEVTEVRFSRREEPRQIGFSVRDIPPAELEQ
jgi:hypothetical protein